MINDAEGLRIKWCMINHDQWCRRIKNQEMPKDQKLMNHTCWWSLDWMELNPLSCPRVVNIVESLSVVNNVISSFRINNVNVCETSLTWVWQLWLVLFVWLWMPSPHRSVSFAYLNYISVFNKDYKSLIKTCIVRSCNLSSVTCWSSGVCNNSRLDHLGYSVATTIIITSKTQEFFFELYLWDE